MRGTRHTLRTLALLASVAALSLGTAGAARSAGPAALLPPDLDYARHCAAGVTPPPVLLDRDWTAWSGEPIDLPADDVYALAAEYLRGSDRVEKSSDTALKMLADLEGRPNPDRPRLDRLMGRILVEAGRGDAEVAEGEMRLRRALAAGETRAALDLAKLYGPTGPASLRDPQKARELAQTAAASGDADGKLLFATILDGDPNVPDGQKRYATESALLALIGDIVAGNCNHLVTVGLLYQRGDLVGADIDAAIAWFTQAAETGDAKTQERLGDLLSGPRVEVNDFERALDYYQAAADQGRPAAALRVGQDYATGLVRPRDLDKALHYLTLAAERGSRDGNLWLARLYSGDFGGPSDWDRAKRHYRNALGTGRYDIELATEFGLALLGNGAVADLPEARSLLLEAAYQGSGIAAVKVGEILLDEARADPSLYGEAETFMRLGDALGRSEAARHLAELSLCPGPLFDPTATAAWNARAIALGADNLILNEGIRLLASPEPSQRHEGRALIRQVAVAGDPRAVGYALAQLQSTDGSLGADPDLRARLETFAAGNAADPVFTRSFEFARIAAALELSDGGDQLDAALATLDGYIDRGDGDAAMLKAALLRDHRSATPEELIPLYEVAAVEGIAKSMRELGSALLAAPDADIDAARSWLQKAAAAGDIKAELRLVDTSADTALAKLQTIARSGAVCSVDAMVNLAKTYAATPDPVASTEAAHWLATATQVAGDRSDDLVRIANAYRRGVAGADSVGEAEPLLARAMQLGNPDAAFELAEGHLDGDWPDADIDTAHQLLAGLAADGNAEAAAKLLRAIADGDIEAPAAQVASLATQGRDHLDDAGATFSKLARLDEDGAFGSPDAGRRLEWLRFAAESGDSGAMMRLYRTYATGIGVNAAPDIAVAWLQKAADVGDPRAAKELAAAYTVGFGTTADPERAAFWRARAGVN